MNCSRKFQLNKLCEFSRCVKTCCDWSRERRRDGELAGRQETPLVENGAKIGCPSNYCNISVSDLKT